MGDYGALQAYMMMKLPISTGNKMNVVRKYITRVRQVDATNASHSTATNEQILLYLWMTTIDSTSVTRRVNCVEQINSTMLFMPIRNVYTTNLEIGFFFFQTENDFDYLLLLTYIYSSLSLCLGQINGVPNAPYIYVLVRPRFSPKPGPIPPVNY